MGYRNRHKEAIVYLCLWVIVITLYLVDVFRHKAELNMPLFDAGQFVRTIASLGPFIVLFLINNFLLIPRYLLSNKLGKYIVSIIITLSLFMTFQVSFSEDVDHHRPHKEGIVHHNPNDISGHRAPRKDKRYRKPPRPFFPGPFVFDLTYAFLIIGGNVAIALVFQRYDDRLEKEKLMKASAENQLSYLKAQISPHFYMNMLNNIHGMIEIDPEKAQSMVLDMSRLMRYMLYESSKPGISLEREINFLVNFFELMKLRYDKDKVNITYNFPGEKETKRIIVPPLLFLAFIENAFKHGISYRKQSIISVAIVLSGRRLIFSCMNTKNPVAHDTQSGVGLANIKQRLGLLYGERAELNIDNQSETFTVLLSIPYDENQDCNH